MPETTTDTGVMDTLLNMLPATKAELLAALPDRVHLPNLILQAKQSGHHIKNDHGVFRLRVDAYEQIIDEHREVAYHRTRSATASALYPSERKAIIARLWQEEFDELEAPVRREKLIIKETRLRDRHQVKLAELISQR